MKQKIILLLSSLFLVSSESYADWTDGKGVVFFDSEERKLIYADDIYPLKDDDYSGYRVFDNLTQAIRIINPYAYLPRDFKPNGAIPNKDYTIIDGAVTINHIDDGYPTFYSQISRSSEPITTRAGATWRGGISLSIGRSQCVTNTLSVDAGISFYRIVKAFPKLFEKYALGPKVGYSRGWSSCSTESETHSCFGSPELDFTSETWAQREAKLRYGTGKNWPSEGKIERYNFRGQSHGDAWDAKNKLKEVCKDAGGKYVSPWWSGNTEYCKHIGERVSWVNRDLYPTPGTTTDKKCRVIKAFK